jgi:hypothetical protein
LIGRSQLMASLAWAKEREEVYFGSSRAKDPQDQPTWNAPFFLVYMWVRKKVLSKIILFLKIEIDLSVRNSLYKNRAIFVLKNFFNRKYKTDAKTKFTTWRGCNST